MGLFSFIKNAGAKIFGGKKKEETAAAAAAPVELSREDALKAELIKCEAEKIGCRQAFLADLNIKLQQHSHAFLKFDYGSLAELPASSDLDLAVGKNTIPSLTDFCSNHPLVQRNGKNPY